MAARKIYEKYCNVLPHSLDFHVVMAKLESAQPKLSLKSIRKVYENAIDQFGKSFTGKLYLSLYLLYVLYKYGNIYSGTFILDVWVWYVKFEEQFGDPANVSSIYYRATTTLNKTLIDVFVSEFHLNKAESIYNSKRYFWHE